MQRFKSKSEKRLIIGALVNGKEVNFLIDTGASVGMMDSSKEDVLGLIKGRKYNGTIVGAGGEMKKLYHCDTFAHIGGKVITQFLLADIGNIVESIHKETGVEIAGIISLPQMKMCGIQIDANDNLIIIE